MWFSSADTGNWKIGYATSADGINWTPYATNPVLTPTQSWEGNDADGASVIFDGTTYEVFYHGSGNLSYATSTNGINWTKPADKNPVLIRGNAGTFDANYLAGPGAVRLPNGTTLLYYGGNGDVGGVGGWRIGLAADGPIILAEPTPTPTPTPTPIPPVVVVPGMFASWNKDALLHNDTVSDSAWKLPSFIHEYDGLIQTFRNLGFVDNTSLFVFTYDWRKKLTDTADVLNNYITTNIPSGKVNIVGHSLGGLVGRIYAQKYGTGRIDKLITVGSPHKGVPQAYKAFAGGDITRENFLEWLAIKIILILNRSGTQTDRSVVADRIPVTRDLLPVYDFLQRNDGTFVDAATMTYKNDTLLTYKNTFSDIFGVFQSITGQIGATPLGYRINTASPADIARGIYPDGRPVSDTSATGDYTVVSQSAEADSDVKKLAAGHGELVYKKDNIKEILNSLNLSYTDATVVEGKQTKIFPDLLVMIRSPATISLERKGKTWTEDDGIIFVENAGYGLYELKVRGTAKGKYTVTVGQITETDDYWDDIKGEITKSPPGDQTDIYFINFPTNPLFPSGTGGSSSTTTSSPTTSVTKTITGFIRSFFSTKAQDVQGIASQSAGERVPTMETYEEPKPKEKSIAWLSGLFVLVGLAVIFRKKIEEVLRKRRG